MSNIGNKVILAKNLKYYMDINNIDRYGLCKALNFKYSTVSEWLSANKYPRIDKIELMADFFGIQKSNLIEKKSFTNTNLDTSSPNLTIIGNGGTGKSTLMNAMSENISFYQMYDQLDTEDKAEIRGEIKQMLKAPKYSASSISKDIADTLKISDSTKQKSKQ